MATKKFKIEFYDDGGTRHTISLEGNVQKKKIVQILDYVELMGGVKSSIPTKITNSDNKFIRIKNLVLSNYPSKIFSSKDIQVSYFEHFGENIPLSTASTYLSRLVDRGLLNRGGSSSEWHYALSSGKEINYP